MRKNSSKIPFFVILLTGLLIIEGLLAIFGGFSLSSAPDGSKIGISVDELSGSPFPNFLIPGLFLFFVNGTLPIVTAYALIKKPSWNFPEKLNFFSYQYWALSFSIYIGVTLMLWVAIEMIWISYNPLQTMIAFWGAVLVFLSLLPSVSSHFRK